jgi:hypothetical protein
MHNEEPPGLRHAGTGRHPDPSSTWIPFFNGITDSVRHLGCPTRLRGNDESRRGSMFWECQPFSCSFSERKLMDTS